jgi:hypothetical protein
MKLSNERMVRSAERALKRTGKYQEHRELGYTENYEVLYILVKGKPQNSDEMIAFAGIEETVISFHPFKNGEVMELWDFNVDSHLFEYLEFGYELAGMTVDSHYNVWCTIEEWHNGDIENKKGMQKYLGYCKRNHITKEKLQADAGYSGMDVMTLYDAKADRTKAKQEPER